jgi:hypothetical protein
MRSMHFIAAAICVIALSACSGPKVVPAGMATSHGVSSQVRPHAPQFKLIYAFTQRKSGVRLLSGVAFVSDGMVGTTFDGGFHRCDCGVAYLVDASGQERVLYSFKGTYSKKLGHIGRDGWGPEGGLLPLNGALYGTTSAGGETGLSSSCAAQFADGCGTVFYIDSAGKEHRIHIFEDIPDGREPVGDLIAVNGTIYGVTAEGGRGGGSPYGCRSCGTIYAIDAAGTERIVYAFTGLSDGEAPAAGLTAIGARLYGTTSGSANCNGSVGCGSVFWVSPAGKFHLIHDFAESEGEYPQSNLVDVNGTLYGTLKNGGSQTCPPDECGAIYAIGPAGKVRIVWQFGNVSNDGAHPLGSLAVLNGIVYGTTELGGGSGCRFGRGCGTIFSFDPNTGQETPIYTFTSAEGVEPQGLTASNGVLYGTAQHGGGRRGGTIFSIVP